MNFLKEVYNVGSIVGAIKGILGSYSVAHSLLMEGEPFEGASIFFMYDLRFWVLV